MISQNDFPKNELEKIASFKTFLFAVGKFHCCSHYFNKLGRKVVMEAWWFQMQLRINKNKPQLVWFDY